MMCDASFTKHTYCFNDFNTFRPLPNDRLSLENSKTERSVTELCQVRVDTESSIDNDSAQQQQQQQQQPLLLLEVVLK
jgi:hypothetical protein